MDCIFLKQSCRFRIDLGVNLFDYNRLLPNTIDYENPKNFSIDHRYNTKGWCTTFYRGGGGGGYPGA